MRRLTSLLMVGFALGSGSLTTHAAPSVELHTGWLQQMPVGAAAEIGISVLSGYTARVQVEVVGVQGRTIGTVAPLPGEKDTLWLPLRGERSPARVVIREGQDSPVTLPLPPSQEDWGTPVAVAASGVSVPTSSLPGTARVFYPSLAELPHRGTGYEGLGALVVDATTLVGLDASQAAALETYLGVCGRFVGVGLSPLLIEATRRRAGCAGQFVGFAASPDQVSPSLAEVLARAPPSLPSREVLRSLLGPIAPDGTNAPLLAVLVAYAGLLLVLTVAGKLSNWVLAVPVAAGVLVLVSGTLGAPHRGLAVWSQAFQGEERAHFVGLVRLDGTGRETAQLPLPGQFAPPVRETGRNAYEIRVGDDPSGACQMRVPVGYLGRQEFVLSGVVPYSAPLRFRTENGIVVIENQRDRRSEPGVLALNGALLPVPALDPGDSWNSSAVEELGAPRGPEERLLREWSFRNGAGLLLPHTPAWAGQVASDEEVAGWLLLRARAGEPGT